MGGREYKGWGRKLGVGGASVRDLFGEVSKPAEESDLTLHLSLPQ